MKSFFVCDNHFSYPIVLEFGTEHGSTTAVLCAKFQNKWGTENKVMDKQDLRDLSLRWVSEGCAILHQLPGLMGYQLGLVLDGFVVPVVLGKSKQ